jgi:predicted dehydrogenase
MSRSLGVLIHGAGWVSTQHIKAFENNPHTRIVAISSRKLESAKKRAEEANLKDVYVTTDFEKALERDDVDIVSICTPAHLHAENAIAAARSGKHIALEKPVANSVRDMKRMRDAVRKAKVRTVVSFVLRWNPLFETVKSMIADDTIGEVQYVEADYQHNIASWWSGYDDARKKSTGVSAFQSGGCHAIDAIRWFAGQGRYKPANATEVFAYSGGYRKGIDEEFNYFTNRWNRTKQPLEYNDLEVALVKFGKGKIGKVATNLGAIMPYAFPFQIFGKKGSIKDNRVWSHKFSGQKDWATIPSIPPDSADVAHHPFQGEMDHFVECILNGKESHANFDDAIHTQEIAFAALECYRTNKPVRLPLIE